MARRLVQIAAGLNPGDAISNEVRWIHALAAERPYRQFFRETHIYAEHIHPELDLPVENAERYRPAANDIVLLHYGIAADTVARLTEWKVPLFLRYHNVTPAHFYRPYSLALAGRLERARRDLRRLRPFFAQSFAASAFSASELAELGFAAVRTLPVLFGARRDPFASAAFPEDGGRRSAAQSSEGQASPASAAQAAFSDASGPLALFVGRIAPNKGHADLLKIFYYLRRILPSARLAIAGGRFPGLEHYDAELRHLRRALGLEDSVRFTGFVSQAELDALYARADLFLSASAHEGFGVPLLEAMQAGAPVLAYAPPGSAAAETLGGAGALFRRMDHKRTAELAAKLLIDEGLQAAVVRGQRERVAAFDPVQGFAEFYRAVREVVPA